MESLSTARVIEVLLEQFAEAYEGPSKPYTWFVDNKPDSGLFGSIASLPADLASTPATPGTTTIAAHVEHLRWSLALANEYLRGGNPDAKWQESWSVRSVDPTRWERLQADLRREYESLRQAIAARTDWSGPMVLEGTVALVPHAAYHLGAIRQMIGLVRSRSAE